MFDYYRYSVYNIFTGNDKKDWNLIKAPVLILMGRNDSALDYRLGEPSLKMCKNGKLHLLDNRHFFQRENPKETNSLIDAFLSDD